MFIKTIFSTLILFVLIGCKEDFPVYSKFINEQNISKVKCLNYMVFNKKDEKLLEDSFGYKDDDSCFHRVVLTKYRVESCQNPVVKSIGSDFNGYIRVEVKKGLKCYYKAQSDYKSDLNGAYTRVLNKIKIDFNP